MLMEVAEQTKRNELKEKVLDANRKVHAREKGLYLSRHPEQTNFYQTGILRNALDWIYGNLTDPDSSILDLGCGTGYFYKKLLSRGYRLTGVDLSETMIRVLEDQIPKGAGNRLKLVVSDAEEFLEREDKRYDAVVISALLHHLYDYESVMKLVCGKLRPGGLLLIFFEPLKQQISSSLMYTWHRLLAGIDEFSYKFEMDCRGIPLYKKDYELADYQRRFGGIDPRNLIKSLRTEKMTIVNLQTYCARRYGLSAFLASQILRTHNTFNLMAKKRQVD